jgi:SAM-dependent methyltransferase
VAGADDWDSHWEHYADSVGRNPAQAFRRRVVLRLLSALGPPRRYLDIGSGPGDLAVDVAAAWPEAEIAGVELSSTGVRIAAGKLPTARFEQVDLVADTFPAEGMAGWATHATCSEVLEHLDDPTGFLVSARRWLAPEAALVVTVPGGPMSAFDHHIGHRRHYTPGDLADLLEGAGFRVGDCGGAGFPLFNLYRRAVISRGERLIEDVDASGGVPWVGRVAMAGFAGLLRVSPTRGRRGWQLYAAATVAGTER